MDNTADIQHTNATDESYVVAIGASAGGLEAIQDFFDNISADTGLAYVVIQHLSTDYKSILAELLGRHTSMPVSEAYDGAPLLPNSVYVIPNNKFIQVYGNTLKLVEKDTSKGHNTAIDSFLYTLATEKRDKAIAIILSGTGTDGSKGIEKIKQAGGLVMVQDPATARFDGMPNSAIATDCIDYILPPELMPSEIYEHISVSTEALARQEQVEEDTLLEIFALIHKCTAWDFSQYKRPTLYRRITRRMGAGNFKTTEDYLEYLRATPGECQELGNDFLIGVTRFFRDKSAFEILNSQVFPKMLEKKSNGDSLKIWICACSTGEEAYTLAMLLDDFINKANKIISVKIFATDIDQKSIEIAGKGRYNAQIAKDIEPAVLQKYFVKEGNGYAVVPHIRKQIVFATHNLLKDPPFIKNDFISCRNMLIYMDVSLQKKILNTLHFALNTDGYLFLGSSESLLHLNSKMEEISSRWKIFRKTTNSSSWTSENLLLSSRHNGGLPVERIVKKTGRKAPATIERDFSDSLMDDLGYAGVHVDSFYLIKEAIGDYRKYLSLPDKLVNLNILKMVPKDVSIVIGSGLRQSLKNGEKVIIKNIKFAGAGPVRYINLLIKPPNKISGNYFILFSESEQPAAKNTAQIENETSAGAGVVAELTNELRETKLNLQNAIEELETTNEELQSSNEELLSSNEELQSSNEELQSLNEELHTLNSEHQAKIRELIELNNDFDNYFRTTDIGQLFLDEQLRIRKYNSAAVKMINLIESDIGRPINHISTNIRHENLLADIKAVQKSAETMEKEVTLINGISCLLKISLYLQHDKKPGGVVISIVNINALKDLDSIVKGVFDASFQAIMVFKSVRNIEQKIIDFKWIAANRATEKMLTGVALENQLLSKTFPEFAREDILKSLRQVVELDKSFVTEFTLPGETDRCFDVVVVKMRDGIVVTFSDITEKKEAENALRKNLSELNITKEKFRKLSNDLENLVQDRTRELSASEERFRLVLKATNDAIWDWNLSTNEVWWSESFETILGYERNAETSKRNFWLSKIAADERLQVKDSQFKAINSMEDSWTAEYKFLKADGSYANILDRGFVLKDEFGTPYRMVGSMLDVTQLRTAEKEAEFNIDQRKFMAESVPLIVWTASPSGKLQFLNSQFTYYTGIPYQDALGRGWQKVVCSEDQPELENRFKQSILNRVDFSMELQLKRSDGEYRWHLLRARAKKDTADNILMWVGTLTDIHEQKQANQILEKRVAERTHELQNAIRDLEMSNNNLQQFAYIASHDLKEPLRKIQMFSTELKKRFSEDIPITAVDYINKIITSSARLTKLISDLLTFSTIASNNQFQKTNLQKILNDALSDLELIIAEKNATITSDNLPIIEAIPSQIRQVFQNIINNALKFNKKDTPPRVEIRCQKIAEKSIQSAPSPQGNYVRITISDNGIGFSEDYLEKIFLIFQRLHSKREYEGTGIGLAITKSIIEKHHGLITANSRENEGASFIIILPLTQKEHNEEGKP